MKKFDELEKVHSRYNWHYKDCLTQAQVVTEGINTSTALENSYNLMQSFIQAFETGNTHELKSLINCQDQIGTLMHKTPLTFKHNLTAVLTEQLYLILTAVLKASIAKSNKSNEQLLAIPILPIS